MNDWKVVVTQLVVAIATILTAFGITMPAEWQAIVITFLTILMTILPSIFPKMFKKE